VSFAYKDKENWKNKESTLNDPEDEMRDWDDKVLNFRETLAECLEKEEEDLTTADIFTQLNSPEIPKKAKNNKMDNSDLIMIHT